MKSRHRVNPMDTQVLSGMRPSAIRNEAKNLGLNLGKGRGRTSGLAPLPVPL
jgi:hypothetical protein